MDQLLEVRPSLFAYAVAGLAGLAAGFILGQRSAEHPKPDSPIAWPAPREPHPRRLAPWN
jgi:hypothetical protein